MKQKPGRKKDRSEHCGATWLLDQALRRTPLWRGSLGCMRRDAHQAMRDPNELHGIGIRCRRRPGLKTAVYPPMMIKAGPAHRATRAPERLRLRRPPRPPHGLALGLPKCQDLQVSATISP